MTYINLLHKLTLYTFFTFGFTGFNCLWLQTGQMWLQTGQNTSSPVTFINACLQTAHFY